MLDVISGGRLVAGHGGRRRAEYFSYNVNPTYARERFREAHRPDRQGVDDAGAVPWEGEALLLPLRQPLAAAAAAAAPADLDPRRRPPRDDRVRGPAALRLHGLPYFHIDAFRRIVRAVPRGVRARRATRPGPSRWAGASPIYVAETDAQAREEFEPHFWYFARNLLRNRDTFNSPPGHSSIRSRCWARWSARRTLAAGQLLDLGGDSEGRLRGGRQPGHGARPPEGDRRRPPAWARWCRISRSATCRTQLTRKSMELFAARGHARACAT